MKAPVGSGTLQNSLLRMFADYAVEAGIAEKTFMVGGAVRDIFLGAELKDIDISTEGDAPEAAKRFAEKIGGSFVLLDREFGTARVVKNGFSLDISTLKGGSIEDDLSERDITINAMAIPISEAGGQKSEVGKQRTEDGKQKTGAGSLKEAIIDPFGGIPDSLDGRIRMVFEKNLIDDPLRLLRVYRFAATLGFSVEDTTLASVGRLSPLITSAAVERIAEELRHILRQEDSFKTVKAMADSGLLFRIFPEIQNRGQKSEDRSQKTEVGRQPTEDRTRNAEESLALYKRVENILNDLPGCFGKHSEKLAAYFGDDYRKICLKFSAIFPDAGAAESAVMRLKMSGKEVDFVCRAASGRMTIPNLYEETGGRLDMLKAADLLKEYRDDVYPLLIFGIAAHNDAGKELVEYCERILDLYHDGIKQRLEALPLISGKDLIRVFDLKPSPLFSEIISMIDDMFIGGGINSKEEAFKKIEEMLRSRQ